MAQCRKIIQQLKQITRIISLYLESRAKPGISASEYIIVAVTLKVAMKEHSPHRGKYSV
jgi:hypothetical protein